ncbi:unnamed protein product [Rotaria sp. Silwood1]|nr:unnamed protein product [Rotaria sp. Silwood1]
MFDPIDSYSWLGNISNITSRNLCICQCYTNSNCCTAIYYGRYQMCLLYSAALSQGQLHLMTTSENAVVINFPNRTVIEFGFKAVNQVKTWHLDDVSLKDKNASNAEMLVNGGFENGSLVGWQVLCSSIICGTTAGNITQSNCHTGSYCYEGACQNAYDFLRQTFSVTSGHVYILSFWLYTNGHHSQAAYVNIS